MTRNPSGGNPRTWSPEEYRQFMLQAWPRYQVRMEPAARVRLLEEYLAHLPLHVVGRCPYCAEPVLQHLDTYSLNGFGWSSRSAGYGWAHDLGAQIPLQAHCPHIRIIAEYLNLEGRKPDDLFPDRVIHSGPEVPAIMRVPMRAAGARAVIHRLPIGRFDDAASIPAYSVYFMTYFTATVAEYDAATENWGVHYGRVEDQDVSYELEPWVREGRLRWLAPGQPEQLADAAADAFPYAHIEGDRWPVHIITRAGIKRPDPSVAERLLGLFGRR